MDNKFKKIAATLIAASMLSASMAVPTFASAQVSVTSVTKNEQGVVTGATINVEGEATTKTGKGVAAVYTKDGEMKEIAFSTANLAAGTEAGEHTLTFDDENLKVESGETVKVFLWETDDNGNLANKPLSETASETEPEAELTLVGTYDYSKITTPAQDSLKLVDREVTVDGTTSAIKTIGYVGGGIDGAEVPSNGMTVTYGIDAEEAGDNYTVEFVVLNGNETMSRRLDFSIGDKVYSIPVENWTLSDKYTVGGKSVFTGKVSGVSLAQGSNSVVVGTNDGSYAPDLIYLNLYNGSTVTPTPTPDVKTYTVSGIVDANVASVTLTNAADETKKVDGAIDGTAVTFKDLEAGTYNITATAKDGYDIASIKLGDNDATQVTVTDADVTGLAITTVAKTYTVSGTADANVVTVTLVDTTDSEKTFKGEIKDNAVTFANVPNGTYNVTATYKTNYEKDSITPETVTVNGADLTSAFEIKSKESEVKVDTYAISGTATEGVAKVELYQNDVLKATGTVTDGALAFDDELPAGEYDVKVTYADGYIADEITGTGYADGKLTVSAAVTDLAVKAKDMPYAISGTADEHVVKVELYQNDEVKATGTVVDGVLTFDNELTKGEYDVVVTYAEGYEAGTITGTGYADGKLTISGAVTDLAVTSQVKTYVVSGTADSNVASVTLSQNGEVKATGTVADGELTFDKKLAAGEYDIAATAKDGYLIDTIKVGEEAAAKVTITNADVANLAVTTKADPYKVIATLTATASVMGGSNTPTVTNDAETEYVNNNAASSWWGYALTDFTLPSDLNADKIVSASLEFTAKSNKDGNYNFRVYKMKDDSFDFANLSGDTSLTTSLSGEIGNVLNVGTTEVRGNIDVTSDVKTIAAAGNTRALYVFSGNAAGGVIYGKGATDTAKLPTLKVVLGEQAVLTVKNGDDAVGEGVKVLVDDKEYTTDENGQIKVALTVGEHKYSVAETTSYFGVEENTFTVAENTGYTGDIAVEANTRVTTFAVKSGETAVSGAEIIVKTKDGETVGTYKTGEDGNVTATLLPGEYTYEYAETGEYVGVAATAFTVAEDKVGATVNIALTENVKTGTTVSVTYKAADGTEIKDETVYSDQVYVGEKFTMPAYDTVMKVTNKDDSSKTDVYNYVSGAADIDVLAENDNVINLVYELVGTYDYYEDYNTDVAGWTSAITDRYTVALAGTDTDKYVNVASVSSGGNGTTITNNTITLSADKDYVAEFDLALTGANGQTSAFAVKATSGYALVLQLKTANGTTWTVNGTTDVDLTKGTFYHYKLEKVSDGVKVTITSQDGTTTLVDGVTYANDTATSSSEFNGVVSNAGIAGMQFNTKRYYAGMMFDNLKITSTTPVVETYNVTAAGDVYDGDVKVGNVTVDKDTAKEGETVTVIATPEDGYELGTITVTQGETPVTVNTDNTFVMPAGDVNVTATFTKKAVAPTTYTITKADATNGSFEVSAESAAKDTEVTITATPAEGYEVDTITVTKTGTEETVEVKDNKFTMPESEVTVTVTFKAIDYAVTKADATNGSFTVKKADAEISTANFGDEIILTATANEGFTFKGFTVTETANAENAIAVTETDNANEFKFTMPAKAVTVSAEFAAEEATTFSVSGTVDTGVATVTLTNTDEDAAEGTKTYTVTVGASDTVTFENVANGTYTVTATYNNGKVEDTISPATITVDGAALTEAFTIISKANSDTEVPGIDE